MVMVVAVVVAMLQEGGRGQDRWRSGTVWIAADRRNGDRRLRWGWEGSGRQSRYKKQGYQQHEEATG